VNELGRSWRGRGARFLSREVSEVDRCLSISNTGDSRLRLPGMRRQRGDASQDGDYPSAENRHWDDL
jgi:hypothetical protein